MSNTTSAFIYAPFAIVTAAILLIELARRLKRREDYFFMASCLCVAGWFATDIASLFSGNPATLRYLRQINLIFVGFLPPCMLLFFIKFYRASLKLPIAGVVGIMAIPTINAAVALTGQWHNLLVERLDILSMSPVLQTTIVRGPWFWVHTVFCYVMTITILVFLLRAHSHKKRIYRLPSTLMMIGIVVTLSGSVLTLTDALNANIDLTLIAASLSLILFNLAIINNNSSAFVRFSRGQIIHYLDEFILVLDDKNDVVDYNRPAALWFAEQGISLAGSSMDEVKAALLKKGKPLDDGCYMLPDPHPFVLRLREHALRDEKGDTMGVISVFSDVTQNHFLMERLEAKAKMDSLTGIPNRTAYEGALNRLDNAPHYPLSIILGDLNELKYVNDNFGHQYGDIMLQRAAEILEKHCPENCFIGRIGGDEFVYLLPRTSSEEAHRLIDKVKMDMARCADLPFSMSIALGSAVKQDMAEQMGELIALADGRMYKDKKMAVRGENREEKVIAMQGAR